VGAGFDGGGSWARAAVIAAAAKKTTKDPDVRDKKLSRVFIVMYYMTS
jgi:F0F1-type ATP synthase membrane subunit c/vacuolar-type H+-ATPase subunit K